MAMQEARHLLRRPIWRQLRHHERCLAPQGSRSVSSAAISEQHAVLDQHAVLADLEESSVTKRGPSEDIIASFNPAKQSQERDEELPPSRYKYRPPRYYRGPLHPHQSPRPSDPSSREFIPGPFTLPRLEQTYNTTLASDLLTLCYTHLPEGAPSPPPKERLRAWRGDSPYFANRPLRGPRGSSVLLPLHKPTTFRNIPRLTRVTVHAMAPEASALGDSAWLHVAGMVVQAITGRRVTAHKVRHPVPQWHLKAGRFVSVTADLRGEDMHHFLAKLVDVVLPRVKDWKGVSGKSGDATGNISLGLRPADVALFPEVEVNYDMYPPKMIPGAHITVHTSATTDREGRLLLSAIGFPFHGQLVD